MSDNPFATPQAVGDSPVPSQTKKTPGALTALLIISLILGILGIFGSCVGVAGLAMQSQINALQAQGAGEAELKFQQQMQDIQNQQFVPNAVMLALNFVVAPLLTIGGIGGLMKKSWTPKILGIGLLLAAIFVFIRTIMTIYIQLSMKDAMAKMMDEMMRQQGNGEAAGMASAGMNIFMGVGIAITVLWALVLIGFYLWGWTYIRKDKVKAYFNVA